MFIVFEGLDGAGTTTQTRLLSEALSVRSVPHVVTHEPTKGRVGALIREGLNRTWEVREGETVNPASLALLFAADRLTHLQAVVEPALAEGLVVLSDRYVHSSLAYQGLDLDGEWVARINERARQPDVVIHIDVPVDVALTRIASRSNDRDIFENRETLRRVRDGYRQAYRLRPADVVRVDGQVAIDVLAGEVRAALGARLPGL